MPELQQETAELTLTDKKEETPNVMSFFFRSSGVKSWIAGQHLRLTLNHTAPDSRGEDRYFTISSAPFEKNIMLTTRFDAIGSSFKNALRQLPRGHIVQASKASGNFVINDADNPTAEYVFIAGGIGITPYRSILLDLNHRGKPINVILLYANRDENFLFKDELERVKQLHKNLKIYYFVSPKHIGEQDIRQLVPDLKKPIFYVSGPEPMVVSFISMLEAMDVTRDRLKLDYFPGYHWP